MNSLAIETHGLGKRFGARAALESIDLEVPRGCAFGLLGRNGAGKTTLVRLLLGLAQPTSGTMRLLGHDLPSDRAAALARVGAIVEEPRFHPHLTGRENLHVHAAARDRGAHARVQAALDRVGLGARADDKVRTYSLGMRQYIVEALRAGASGFLTKDVPRQELVAAVKAVANGDAVLSPQVTRQLLDRVAHRLPAPTPTDAASPPSPSASARSCSCSPAACPTRRSRPRSSSPSRPRSATSPTCSASSASATACRP